MLNRGTPAIQQDIVDKLKNRAIEPQAVVSIVSQTSTQVTVIGDINNPGKISINPAGDRVLDAISRAGGIRSPGYEEFVTLQRRGLKGTVYFINLVKNPHENVFVEPGDTLYVYDYQRAFMAFGATGASGQFKFLAGERDAERRGRQSRRSARQPRRTGPGLRLPDRETLDAGTDGRRRFEFRRRIATTFRRSSASISAIRRASLRRASFPMRDNDVIYVDNADQVEITKFLNMLTTVTGATSSVANDAANTKGSILYLENKCATMGGVLTCAVAMSAVVDGEQVRREGLAW